MDTLAFDRVRKSLLSEALASPTLLADVAGLESYISQSYSARSFVELLQNADDAHSHRYRVVHRDGYVIAANDGVRFRPEDFEAICRSSASAKSRGDSIGYRGIGFKSVVSFCDRLHILSGSLAVTFCREKTGREISSASRVPLIRIPHRLDLQCSTSVTKEIESLQQEGFTTLFVFEQLDHRAVMEEHDAFDATAMLFLKHVKHVQITGTKESRFVTSLLEESQSRKSVSLASEDESQQWSIVQNGNVSLAFRVEAGNAIGLPKKEAVAHAFLPTNEATGLSLKINGDFSTDPSRTKIVLDERSQRCVEAAAKLILTELSRVVRDNRPSEVRPFLPNDEIRIYEFSGPSFEKRLAAELVDKGRNMMGDIWLRPAWLENRQDFVRLASESGGTPISAELGDVEGLVGLLRVLGAKDRPVESLAKAMETEAVSTSTAVAVLAHLHDLEKTGTLSCAISKWKIWPAGGKCASLDQLVVNPKLLDNVPLLVEKFGGIGELKRFVKKHFGDDLSSRLLGSDPKACPSLEEDQGPQVSVLEERVGTDAVNHYSPKAAEPRQSQVPLKKWRTVEIQVEEYLAANGWKTQDVSLRNLGYDIEAVSPAGEKRFFEVKSISRVGELISLTSNEEVVAREKGSSYVLVIALLTPKFLEIDFIPDPSRRLTLVRQCKQWAWICEHYPFSPERVVYVE